MKPWVDITGSGQGLTILRAFGNATVTGASNAELRDLTVENFGGSFSGGTGIHNAGAATRIVRVTVDVVVSTGTPIGILTDGVPPFPGPRLRGVTVSAAGFQARGVRTDGARVHIEDSDISATGSSARGVMNVSGAIVTLTRVKT